MFPRPTADFRELAQSAAALFEAVYTRRAAVRAVRLRAGRLADDPGQTELFACKVRLTEERLGRTLNAVRRRMGFETLLNGSTMHHNI